MSKRRRPAKIDLDSDKLWRLYERLGDGDVSTAEVNDWLIKHAGERPTPPYVALPLPVPTGSGGTLRLYLQLFDWAKSPSWRPYRGFKHDAEPKHAQRCYEHLKGLADLHRLQPRMGLDWQRYLDACANAVRGQGTTPQWALRQARANERRWGHY